MLEAPPLLLVPEADSLRTRTSPPGPKKPFRFRMSVPAVLSFLTGAFFEALDVMALYCSTGSIALVVT